MSFKDGSGNAWTSGVTVTGTAGNAGAKAKFGEVPTNALLLNALLLLTTHGNAMGNTITVKDSNISLGCWLYCKCKYSWWWSNKYKYSCWYTIANVTTVAGNEADINTVAGANSNITAVANDISNVNSVGGAISNVNTVAKIYLE